METTLQKNNITIDDVKQRIHQFDFKSWVKHGVLFSNDIDTMLDGNEIYRRLFEPVLHVFAAQLDKRYDFLQDVGYTELMDELRKQDVSRDERVQISIDIKNVIRECLAPLWIGYFEYPALVLPCIISETPIVNDTRSKFRKELQERNLSFEEASNIIYESVGKRNFALVKDISVGFCTS